jgi:hypothetical protein
MYKIILRYWRNKLVFLQEQVQVTMYIRRKEL